MARMDGATRHDAGRRYSFLAGAGSVNSNATPLVNQAILLRVKERRPALSDRTMNSNWRRSNELTVRRDG